MKKMRINHSAGPGKFNLFENNNNFNIFAMSQDKAQSVTILVLSKDFEEKVLQSVFRTSQSLCRAANNIGLALLCMAGAMCASKVADIFNAWHR
jgi:hypothetical protein